LKIITKAHARKIAFNIGGILTRLHVFPSFSGNNSVNRVGRDSKSSSQNRFRSAFGVKLSQLDYLIYRKPCKCVSPSAFLVTVPYIVRICSHEKMIRPNAWRIVAIMANQFPFWDFPKMNEPRNAMGLHHFPAVVIADRTVSSPPANGERACPNPTGFCFSYFFPESFMKWFAKRSRRIHVAFLATESASRIGGRNEFSLAL
jgi:hypothetical protein